MGFDNECILNIQSLPGEYFCPVCRTLVYPSEALQTQCTHLYCKPCLAYVVATTRACPYDGYLVTEADAKPLTESNKSIAEAIHKIQVHCLYHRSGCQWQGSLSECISHCTSCSYGNSPVVCNRCGTQIIHRQVQEHAQICPGVQPQPQQAGTAQPPASVEQNQLATQAGSQVSQHSSAQMNMGPTASLSSAPVNVAASAPAAASTTLAPAGPTSIAGQAMAITQPQAVVQNPTPEQWYQQQQQQQQQQQLQYQQYYQQYPGYDPYQQHAQYQQQAYSQYPQPQMQSFPQASQAAQQTPVYAQPKTQTLSQPQTLQQAQPQQLQPQLLPQPQVQVQPQPQAHPYGITPQMQIPVNSQQVLVPAQQSQPQMQPQANPPSQLQVVAQQAGHLHSQAHLPAQPSQVQTPVHPQHQQLMPQQHPVSQLPQPPTHPQHHSQPQPQVIPRQQLQQYPQMQSQQHPHLQSLSQSLQQHLPAQSIPQQPAAHAVTGHLSYPQPQQPQQMLPGPPQQRPVYMQPPQQGVPQQLPQHPVQMHSQPLSQQPQMRPTQSHVGVQAQQVAMPPPQMSHHPNQAPVQQQQVQQYPGMHPPTQHHGLPPQSGRSQVHPQHGPFPSQNAGPQLATHPQGAPVMQQYPPTHSQMQQNAVATQGMPALQAQGMVPSGTHGAPVGGSPAPSSLGIAEQTDSKFDSGSEVKGASGPSVAPNNMVELSVLTSQKQDNDFNVKDKGDDGIGDTSKDNKIVESSVNRTINEEHSGKPSEQSEGASLEFTEDNENNPEKKISQGLGEEDGRTERAIMAKAEVEELDNTKVPPHTSASAMSVSQSLNRVSETPIQQGTPGVHPLPSNQDKTSSSFPYPGSGKGEQRLPAAPASEKYPNQMVPYGPLDTQHVASQRPSGPERVLPQHVPRPGPDLDRRFQGPPPYPMPVPGHTHMRPSAQGFAEHMLPPGSFHPEQLGSGYLDPGLQRGPGQVTTQKIYEPPAMSNQLPPQGQLPSSHAVRPRMHAGTLPGPPLGGPPPGPFDSREAMLARGLPPFHDNQINMPHPPYPVQDDKFSTKMSGSYDSRQSDLRPPIPMEFGHLGQYSGPPPSMTKMNGVPGKVPDSLSHGPVGDRFQSLPNERYKSLPEEGFKPLSDEHFRPFPVDPARRMREFEEDLKQFPRVPISDGEGISKMDNYSSNYSRPLDRGPHSWGADAGLRPFDKVMKPFGVDGGPTYDAHAGAMASRVLPSFPSDGVFGDRNLRDDIPKKSDFNQFDNSPFGIGGRDLSDLSSNRFEGGSAHGLNNQSRFNDYSGRDQTVFGERSRPFGLHSEPFGNTVPGTRFSMPSAPFDASETSRMIEQFGSGNPKIGDLDGTDFMTGKSRIGEAFGNHMSGVSSGSPRGFNSQSRMGEHARFGFLPPHLRNREPGFGGNFPPLGFSKESGPFNSGPIQDDLYSSDPSRKRKPGSAGWCRICKIDCETVEGLDLHSQTREHQKVAMDIVLSIKKNSSKKQKPYSEDITSLDDTTKTRAGFGGRGDRP